jgi:hypothetical protein
MGLLDQLVFEINEMRCENGELRKRLERGSEANNQRKLSKADAVHIRELHQVGVIQAEIARTYDVNPATISRIVRGFYHS